MPKKTIPQLNANAPSPSAHGSPCDVLRIRCIRHINVRQQNASESTGAECGGCIAEERDRLRGVLNEIEEMCHRLAFGRAATTAEIIAALRETMKKANDKLSHEEGGKKP